MPTIRRFSKKQLFWLIPLLLVLLVVAALGGVRLLGWHWQGLAWRQGPLLGALWQERDGCRPLQASGIRVKGLWPVVVEMDTLGIGDCPSSEPAAPFTGLPWLPPFDVTVWALQFQDYPPVTVKAHHHGEVWHASAGFRGSQAEAEYHQDDGRWRLTGEVQGGHINSSLLGVVSVRGEGTWKAGEAFQGQATLFGKGLGMEGSGPRGDVTVRGHWRDDAWQLNAALDQPLALGEGWVVSPSEDFHARGQGALILDASGRLAASGPQGSAQLALSSQADRLGRGEGILTLSDGLRGEVNFQWADQMVTVAPFALTLPESVSVRLREPVTLPLAPQGEVAVPLTLGYQELTLASTESQVYWRPNDVQWRGAVTLDGRWQGYKVSGAWRGDVSPVGVRGDPLTVRLRDTDLDLNASVAVNKLSAPDWPVSARLEGRYQQWPFSANASSARVGSGWGGALQGQGGTPPGFSQGGESTFSGQWRWADDLRLLAGARLGLAQAIRGNQLLRPMSLTNRTPLILDGQGVRGDLAFEAGGMVAERWVLPPVTGTGRLRGATFDAAVNVADWGSKFTLRGKGLGGAMSGTFQGETPLVPGISRGLGLITRSGQVDLDGQWHWREQLQADARLRVEKAALDFGGIQAVDLNADLTLGWDGNSARVYSRTPLTLASVDVGTPITAIRMGLDTDLDQWRFDHIHAELLGGALNAPSLVWPAPDWQPAVLTGIDLGELAALQSEPAVILAGKVGGYIPLRLGRHSLAVNEGRLANEGELYLSIPPSSGVQAMAASNQAVALALESLNPLRIDTFQARLDMSDNGWLDAAVTIKGINPLQNRLPVVFNYTHQENVLELLRSLRIGESVTDKVMGR